FSVVVVSTNRVADGVLASGLGLSCAWSAGKTAARIKNTPSVIRVRLIFPSWNFRQIENVLPDARSIQILVRCGRIEQLDLELVDLQPGDLHGLLIILRCGSRQGHSGFPILRKLGKKLGEGLALLPKNDDFGGGGRTAAAAAISPCWCASGLSLMFVGIAATGVSRGFFGSREKKMTTRS